MRPAPTCNACGGPVEMLYFEDGAHPPYVHVPPRDHDVDVVNIAPGWSDPDARGFRYGFCATTIFQKPLQFTRVG